MTSPLRKPGALNWNAAAIELPEIPMLPAGQDAMSATISAVLPTLAAPLAANVATLSAKENMFSGKLGVAQTAYQNSDEAGHQSVGQVVGMLGQLGQQAGQMGQMAGAPAQAAGGQAGMFGSLIQQAMQGAQGAGGTQTPGAQGAAGAPAGAGALGAVGQQSPRDDAGAQRDGETPQPHEVRADESEHEREPLLRADDSRSTSGPVPVTPPESPPTEGEQDPGRRL